MSSSSARLPRVGVVLRRDETVSPLELFFDLVFVLAITQCTTLMAHDPSWRGMGRGLSQRVGPAQAHGRVAKAEQRDTGPDPQPRFVPHEGVDLFRIVLKHGFRCVPRTNRDGPKRPL